MSKQYIVLQNFKGAHDGFTVTAYETGDLVPSADKPMSEELAKTALKEKWMRKATKVDLKKPSAKADSSSPVSDDLPTEDKDEKPGQSAPEADKKKPFWKK